MSKTDAQILIEWNGRLDWVRAGATVESLLSDKELEDCRKGKAIVKDSHGNETGLSGTLTQGVRLFMFYLPKPANSKALDRRGNSM